MDLPFTRAEFFDTFAQYNAAIWPLQLVFLAAAVVTVTFLLPGRRASARWTLFLLAGLWLWMAVVYHGMFFRAINPAALMFAALFAAQGVVLTIAGLKATPNSIRFERDVPGHVGLAIIIYALVLYPVIGHMFGHRYPGAPTFGLPCPTTLFTFGVLLWSRPLRPLHFVIPLAWAFIGFTAALRLGVYEDSGLAVAAAASIGIIIVQRVSRRRATLDIRYAAID